jgi:hypothetical protein
MHRMAAVLLAEETVEGERRLALLDGIEPPAPKPAPEPEPAPKPVEPPVPSLENLPEV